MPVSEAGQEAAAGVGAGGEDVAVWLEGGHGGGGGCQARVAPRQDVPHPLQTLQLLHPLHGGYRGAASAQGSVIVTWPHEHGTLNMNIHRHSHGDVNIEIENIFNCCEEGKLETRLYIFSTKDCLGSWCGNLWWDCSACWVFCTHHT